MARLALLAGGGATATAAAVAGYVIYQSNQQTPDPVPSEPVALIAPQDAAEPKIANETAQSAPEAAPLEGPAAPTFDVVRVEPSGQTLIAGIGPEGGMVEILLDGAAVAEVATDASGKFVEFLDLPASDRPRVLTLAALVDGQRFEGLENIIVAPAVAVAEAEVAPEQVLEAEEIAEAEAPVAAADEAEVEVAAVAAPAAAPEEAPVAVAAVTEAAPDAEPAEVQVAEVESASEAEPVIASQDTVEIKAQDVADTADASEALDVDVAKAETPVAAAETVVAAVPKVESLAPEQTPAVDTASVEVAAAAPAIGETVEDVVDTAAVVETPKPETETSLAETDTASQRAPQTPTVLSATQEGLRVVQAPSVSDTIALDTISYDAQGDVALAGRGSEGFVRIYLDNTPVTTSRIAADGSWAADLPEVDRGIYTLRVDEVDTSGAVTSRVETPFKREDRETLAAQDEGGAGVARVLTVQPGNTLWAIAREKYGQGTLYVRLFEANKDKIGDPNLIYPGQVFDLPE